AAAGAVSQGVPGPHAAGGGHHGRQNGTGGPADGDNAGGGVHPALPRLAAGVTLADACGADHAAGTATGALAMILQARPAGDVARDFTRASASAFLLHGSGTRATGID